MWWRCSFWSKTCAAQQPLALFVRRGLTGPQYEIMKLQMKWLCEGESLHQTQASPPWAGGWVVCKQNESVLCCVCTGTHNENAAAPKGGWLSQIKWVLQKLLLVVRMHALIAWQNLWVIAWQVVCVCIAWGMLRVNKHSQTKTLDILSRQMQALWEAGQAYSNA